MKLVCSLALALFTAPALAADFSGCSPIVYPKSRPEYQLDAEGKLVMDRQAKGVVKAESTDSGDVYVTEYSPKPKKNEHLKLKREGGRPVSLKTSFTDAKGKKTGAQTTRHFAYQGDRCYVRELEMFGEGPDGLLGSFVTYNQKFCTKLLGASKGMTESAKDIARVHKVIEEYDLSLQENGRRLFGYEPERMKADSSDAMDMIASIVGTCRSIGSAYGKLPEPKRARAAAPAVGEERGNSGSAR